MAPKIVVRNAAQKIIYDKELSGQISDGHWEELDTDQRLWGCNVEVFDPLVHKSVGINFTPKCSLDFNAPDLHWLLETRTLGYVQAEFPAYTIEELHNDLDDLTAIVFGK